MQDSTIRLNKYLANLGLCARRDVKKYLKEQEVHINGVRAKEPGERIDPQKDSIKINGELIEPPKPIYIMLNKPKGIISTTADEYGRKNVLSLVPHKGKLYPVGRLDKDTTGLILLTNDGELTNQLTHPRYHVNKVYKVTIENFLTKEQLRALRNGVLLDDGITAPAEVKITKQYPGRTIFEMTIHEGRNRQIRRMCETVGANLLELERVTFGPIPLGNLKLGGYRDLTPKEIAQLRPVLPKNNDERIRQSN